MNSTAVSSFIDHLEPPFVSARDPHLTAAVKTAIVDRLGTLPTLRAQRAAAAIVRRIWPGFREA
jgi:hypothetical protein